MWFSEHYSDSHKICKFANYWVCYTFPVIDNLPDSIWTAICTEIHKRIQQKMSKSSVLTGWPQSALHRQTGNAGERGKAGVPAAASPRISSETKSQNLNTVWHVETRSQGRCHTACFVCLLTVQQKCAIPLMPFPRFHLPQAKRADTMKVYSRKLIKSSCLPLHMAASQPPIYKEYNEKNLKKEYWSSALRS